MGKNSKRPKSYYINKSKRRKIGINEISSNMSGFLCFCNSNEKLCVQEAYNILNEFANKLHGPEVIQQLQKPTSEASESSKTKPSTDDSCDSDGFSDIESALKSEVEDLQNQAKLIKDSTIERRFQQVMVHVNNCVFIKTTLEDPVKLCVSILDDIHTSKKQKTQRLLRMIPVQRTCKAFILDIEKAAKELILKNFPQGPVSYYVEFKTRNNASIGKITIQKSLCNIVKEVNPEAYGEYKTPEILLNIDIVKNICCLSLLPEYFTKYCKYNLIKIAGGLREQEVEGVENGNKITSLKTSVGSTQDKKKLDNLDNIINVEIEGTDISVRSANNQQEVVSLEVNANTTQKETKLDTLDVYHKCQSIIDDDKEKENEVSDSSASIIHKEKDTSVLDINAESNGKDNDSVDVSSNSVEKIQDDSIDGLNSVQTLQVDNLDVSSNSVEKIQDDSIDGLNSVQTLQVDNLDVSSNSVEKIQDDSIDGLNSVQTLQVDNLDVSSNSVEKIQDDSIDGLNSVQTLQVDNLDVSSNSVEKIQDDSIDGLNSVQTLQVDNLDVSSNSVEKIQDDSIDGLNSVQTLQVDNFDVSSNSVEKIQVDSIDGLNSIQTLQVDNLDVSSNSVEKIQDDSIDGLNSVQTLQVDNLDVSSNSVQKGEVGSVDVKSSIQNVQVDSLDVSNGVQPEQND